MINSNKVYSKKEAKKLAWTEFSKFIRLRDAILTTNTDSEALCVSCGRRKPVFAIGGMQAGHFIPGRGNAILFNEKIVHAQCYHCNVGLKGNWVAYEAKMVELYGRKEVERLKLLKKETIQTKTDDYLEIRDKYRKKYNELKESFNRTGKSTLPF